ncbi:hypothetical protein [Halopiger djelfimassiliensis]|uniref:hypothetical protein n=1 Tax=Halopiger djelfimassiliensis TaxID=1293047 RepID=UPI0006777D7B|nr:hypothetical protein [Halopiger djelfimassiliensis]
MTLDRAAAERRRFARLLGTDGELGSGLPIGTGSSRETHRTDDEDGNERVHETDREHDTGSGDR